MNVLASNPITFPTGAQVARLSDGRLHLHHGPIDIIARAWGDPEAIARAEENAARRFASVLPDLCAELPALRSENAVLTGLVAKKMAAAIDPFREDFITPMAAVAGAVADWIVQDFCVEGIDKAYVNNGGDIAFHLAPSQSLTCAIAAQNGYPDRVVLESGNPARGLATSGWRGRSWSLGIADSVTVVALTAAMADAAATMIANAVNLPGHPDIERRPATDLQADSDLGSRLVTTFVPDLSKTDRNVALDNGLAKALKYQSQGLIEGAALFLQGETRTTSGLALTI